MSQLEGGKSGGLARVATRIKQLAPQLVTLGGDYLSPSALGTARVDGQQLAGKQMVDVLNHVGVQWATLGNHEFDVSEAAFKARMAEQKFSVVVSNATDAQGQPPSIPFWLGEAPGRSDELSHAVSASRRTLFS